MGARHLAVVALLVLGVGCGSGSLGGNDAIDETTVAADRVEPGVGVWIDGAPVALGAARTDAKAALGEPAVSRDLGPLGVRAEFPAAHLAIVFTGADDAATVRSLSLVSGFVGKAGEVGLGSTRAQVEAAFGAPVVDPLLGASLYPAKGLTFRFVDDAVSEILLQPAS